MRYSLHVNELGKLYIRKGDVDNFRMYSFGEAAQELNQLRAEIERVTKERDEHLACNLDFTSKVMEMFPLIKQRDKAREQRDRAMELLLCQDRWDDSDSEKLSALEKEITKEKEVQL
jgi:hypothetical protein